MISESAHIPEFGTEVPVCEFGVDPMGDRVLMTDVVLTDVLVQHQEVT